MERAGRNDWLMLAGLCIAEAVLFVNTTAFNLALPSVSVSFNASTGAQQWMVSVYSLCFVAVLLIAGFLGDRLGYRRVLLSGLTVYALASLLGSLSGSVSMLIAARALLGLSAGIFIPMGLALINSTFPAQSKGKAVTTWTIAGMLGVPFGPVIGGGMTVVMGWKGLFVFDLFAMLVALAINWVFLPQEQPKDNRNEGLPWLQAALMVSGVGLFSAGLINAQKSLLAPDAVVPIAVGIVLSACFVTANIRSRNPLTDLGLLGYASYRTSAVALLLLNYMVFGVIFILPTYLQTVLGHNALQSGMMLMPMIAAAIIGAFLNSIITARLGQRVSCLLDLLVIAAGVLAMAAGVGLGSYVWLAIGQMVSGLGMGAGQPVAFNWALADVPEDRSGQGSSLLSVFQQLGSILGIGVFGSLQGGFYTTFLAKAVGTKTPQGLGATIGQTLRQAARLKRQSGISLRNAAINAYGTAAMAGFIISAAIVIIVTMLLAFTSIGKPQTSN
ncbi:MFS transporter [Bifidobacterium sp. ESL0690]|uniref:MFS transporter n=1 Tax=Bifidobacterium sp. ESL0690 TaxID=2983214 RepID=UPI0023F713DD|nr:MFS transporter [Bifidobacterium sp. ESL0690]WEV47438.1 MFS transporter [Bifidobacterium sp. ESL0690]